MSLLEQMQHLEASGLVYPVQVEPELEYLFRHALVQDAAYDSLLKSDRRILHAAVAQTLEKLYPSRLEEIAAALADHYERAEDVACALRYYRLAARASTRLYANEEAAFLFERAIALSALPESLASQETVNDLYSQYGRVLELLGRHVDAIAIYRQTQARAVHLRDRRLEMDSLIAQAVLCATPSSQFDIVHAASLCEQALAIAIALKDREAESRVYWILLLVRYFANDYEQSIAYGEKSLEIARVINHRERLAFTLNDLARTYGSSGRMSDAYDASLEARLLWEEMGNLPMLADNLSSYAEGLFLAGRCAESLQAAQRGYDISQKIGNVWGAGFSLSIQATAHWLMGNATACLECARQIRELDPKQDLPFVHLSTLPVLVQLYMEMGALAEAEQEVLAILKFKGKVGDTFSGIYELIQAYFACASGNLDEARSFYQLTLSRLARKSYASFIPYYLCYVDSSLAMAEGRYADAIKNITEEANALHQALADVMLPEMFLWRATALEALGQLDEAQLDLDKALELALPMQQTRIIWKIQAALAQVSDRLGHHHAAEAHRRAARSGAQGIVEQAPQELGKVFLNQPAVQTIFQP